MNQPNENFQDFEVPQQQKPIPAPTTEAEPPKKKNPLFLALAVMVALLVILLLVAVTIGKRNPKSFSKATPIPTAIPVITPPPSIQISSSSAFFPFVGSLEDLNNQLDAVDLKESQLAPPDVDLMINFGTSN
jgi:hypothetical protein